MPALASVARVKWIMWPALVYTGKFWTKLDSLVFCDLNCVTKFSDGPICRFKIIATIFRCFVWKLRPFLWVWLHKWRTVSSWLPKGSSVRENASCHVLTVKVGPPVRSCHLPNNTDREKSLIKAKFHNVIQLANQLAGWSQTCSRADRELDTVMEFGKFHYTI